MGGYGLSPWGASWGDPFSGYLLGSVSIAAAITVASMVLEPCLTPISLGCVATVNPTSIANQMYEE